MSAIQGWQRKRFEEFGELFSGSTPSTANGSYWDGNIVWITPADLSKLNSRYIHHSGKQITEKGLDACSTHLLPVGSIVLSSRAPIGYVALPTVPFCTNQGCKTIKLKTGYDSEFAYYNVLFNVKKIKDLGEGTTFAEISKTALAGVEIDFPQSINEQAKIAEILSTVDRAIEETKALVAKQQRIKTGLMQDLLTRGIDEHGNLRSEQTHKFKDSLVGRIPVEWEISSLEEVADFVTSGSRGWAQYYSLDGPIFLRIGNLTRNHINLRLDDIVRVNPPLSSEGKRTSVSAGDLLISITADLGVIGVIPEGFGEAYVNQHIALVRLVPSKVNPRFIGWFLSGRRGQTQFEKLNESGAKAGLNLPTVRRLLIPVMNRSEQTLIAEVLDASTQQMSEHFLRLNKLRSLKAALMQDLLTGRKRVTGLLASKPQREKVYAGQ
jgi:type I restriction enzyme S subunit